MPSPPRSQGSVSRDRVAEAAEKIKSAQTFSQLASARREQIEAKGAQARQDGTAGKSGSDRGERSEGIGKDGKAPAERGGESEKAHGMRQERGDGKDKSVETSNKRI